MIRRVLFVPLLLSLIFLFPFWAGASLISGQGHGGNQILSTGHIDRRCQNPSEEENPDWEAIIRSSAEERGSQKEHAGERNGNHHDEDGTSDDQEDDNSCPPGMEEVCGGGFSDDDFSSDDDWGNHNPPRCEGNETAATVPEPGSLLLIGGGLIGLAGIRNRAGRNGS